MSALSLGLIAALCWGLHDVLVRRVSQSVAILPALLMVLTAGTVLQVALLPVAPEHGAVTGPALAGALLAGVFYLLASVGLYAAFQRGPVRLVAPLIASYPILSVGYAALSGAPVSALQWMAVFAIIIGVSIVAAMSDDGAMDVPSKPRTIVYALLAAVGFAGTFALGQAAGEVAGHLTASLITRVTSIALLAAYLTSRRLPLLPPSSAWPVLIVMGLLDGVALYAVLSAGGLPDAQYAAVAASTFGLLTIVLAWVFLKERMTSPQWAGCAVAFGGIGYLAL
ncbi:putative membrane protein [Litoreibacter ponti]|uniref:Putative membrane protein n=1 Tax=Litoreibacter ponti TaxID=1510457 RepID=A0A2T6BDS8_9RHOB|nr:DMT family transporter [Litoreibacter ponti]PTX54184.1 putative membrane protein [Litoreibacter ponti]